jgi:DNA-binding MarR family transcriptional regulator
MTRPRARGRTAASETGGLIDALVQAAFVTMAVLNKVAADGDLSLTQLRVLAILRDRTVGMTALADYLGLEKSTMSGLVERAEKRGLLERAPSPSDGRVVEVSITSRGMDLAERMYAQVEQSLTPMTNVLSSAERERLQGLLERMLGTRDRERGS